MWYVVILLNLVLILNYTDHDRGSVLRRHARFRASGRSELTVDGVCGYSFASQCGRTGYGPTTGTFCA